MTDHKFTDEEIIKALECCTLGDCFPCAYGNFGVGCRDKMNADALALINRQKAEIERLEGDLIEERTRRENAVNAYHEAKAKSIKEFAENLTQDIKSHRLEMNMNGLKGTHRTDEMTYETIIEYIDNLVKEMTETK